MKTGNPNPKIKEAENREPLPKTKEDIIISFGGSDS